MKLHYYHTIKTQVKVLHSKFYSSKSTRVNKLNVLNQSCIKSMNANDYYGINFIHTLTCTQRFNDHVNIKIFLSTCVAFYVQC